MSSIPASAIVNVTPSVLAAGGNAIDVIGLMLTSGTRIPIGTVPEFASAAAVSTYFGAGTPEALNAAVYFEGFDNSAVKPGKLRMAQYPTAAVSAYLRGGNISALTLAQLQALSGPFAVTIDSVVKTGTVNLATATSFSSAANLIADGLGIEGAAAASFTGSIATTVLTVTAVASGTLAVGQFVHGTGVTAGTYITALGTGTGGTGTYTVSASQTVVSEAMTSNQPGVTYDSVSGALVVNSGTTGATSTIGFASGTLATSLKMTSATGAVTSQGAAAGVPATFMDAIVNQTQDWVTFMTIFDPDVSGNANKLLFATWNATKNNRYAYVCWDTDTAPAASNNATGSLGRLIAAADIAGTVLIGRDSNGVIDATYAAFVCGAAASIDFEETNGRADFAFRAQTGLLATVTDETSATNLQANGYNVYGAYATANQDFVFFYPGTVSGDFRWLDSYIDEIWLNTSLQVAMMVLLTNAKSIPYNTAGYAQIEQAGADPINAAINFGAIRFGVALSASQAAQVNSQAGLVISNTLTERGYYFQVKEAAPTVRQNRGTPPITLWYMDGESVQQINLSSIELQ